MAAANPPIFNVAYGTYQHLPGTVEYSRTQEIIRAPTDEPMFIQERWDLNGLLNATGFSDCHTQAGNLIQAYASDGKDIGLLANGQPTHMVLYNAATISGVMVTRRPSFPSNRDAAYITQLPFSITVEAQLPVGGTDSFLITKWEETLDFEGGGPLRGYLETLIGKPQPQQRKEQTIYRAIQAGSATGLYFRPTPPAALFPAALTKRPAIRKISPQRRANGDVEWGITWRYEYESDSPLSGDPTLWGG